MIENNYVVIMAGGIGSRFWPYSRQDHPKQFIDILGTGKSLLQHTVDRFKNICPMENVYVVTNKSYGELVSEQLPDLSKDQILLEPTKRNTAPCIGYSSYKIAEKNPEARIIVSPSDHAIFNENKFEQVVIESIRGLENNDALVTIGIKPSRPETGYGYIQFFDDKSPLKKVKTFTEKPDTELAKKFIESGEFVWNAGIFIWSANAIKKAFSDHLPEMAEVFEETKKYFYTDDEQSAIDEAYSHCRNISIDYGIMEKASNVYVMLAEFDWSDLGSWNSLYEISEKDNDNNVHDANVLVYDSKNCMFRAPKDKLIIAEGLDGYLIADCGNALVICKKDHEKKFREFVNDVKIKKGRVYL
jgi:mannose-1-phosphate guanylyltransferase